MLVDTHCHLQKLDLSAYNNNLDVVIEKAKDSDVGSLVCVCLNLEDFLKVLKIAETYPNVYATLGIQPSEYKGEELDFEKLVKMGSHPKVIGIGETGLDYHYLDNYQVQQDLFITHIKLALKLNKPIIVHSRNAQKDTIKLLRDHHADLIGGIMHCFTEDLNMAQDAIALNFYISFSGIITFKNATQLQEVAKNIPLNKILLESDSPYLAPVPNRGKQNEPAFIKYTAYKLVDLHNVSYQTIANTTTNNFKKLFKLL